MREKYLSYRKASHRGRRIENLKSAGCRRAGIPTAEENHFVRYPSLPSAFAKGRRHLVPFFPRRLLEQTFLSFS